MGCQRFRSSFPSRTPEVTTTCSTAPTSNGAPTRPSCHTATETSCSCLTLTSRCRSTPCRRMTNTKTTICWVSRFVFDVLGDAAVAQCCTALHTVYPVCGMVRIKEPLLLIGKSSPYGGSRFPLSLYEWSFTICLTPYNRCSSVLYSSWHCVSCLWDGAYKRTLAVNRKE